VPRTYREVAGLSARWSRENREHGQGDEEDMKWAHDRDVEKGRPCWVRRRTLRVKELYAGVPHGKGM
jgi:hypothetical protein